MKLMYEEQCLIACFDGISREEVIKDIESKLLYLDADIKELAQQTLNKIRNMTDAEFNKEMVDK